MTFLSFLLLLVVSSLVATLAFSFVMMPVIGLLAVVARTPALAYPVLGLSAAVQVYFWIIWGAYCSSIAARWATGATSPGLYYVFAFFGCTSPIAWMSEKEIATASSTGEVAGIQRGAVLYSLVAIAAYVVFALWPSSKHFLYGWVDWVARLEPDTMTVVGALVLLLAVGLMWRTRRR